MNNLAEEINGTTAPPGSAGIWWLGQAGYVIKSARLVIYIDPYLSAYAEKVTRGQRNEHIRMMQPPLHPREVTGADIVLCTHNHADHIDPEGIPAIAQASARAKFIVPECARQTLLGFKIDKRRILTMRGNDSLEVSGITVTAVPAKHERFDRDRVKGYPYLSYIIKVGGLTLLHMGDTVPYKRQVGRILPHGVDVAFVPINGRDEFRHNLGFEGNFNIAEAIGFAKEIKAGLTVPMHSGMFYLNTGDVGEFSEQANREGLNKRKYKCLSVD